MDETNQNEINPEIEKLKNQADEYLNGWKRAQADYINYKKDENKRVQDLMQFANQGIILELMEVLDNLNTAVVKAPPDIQEKEDWFNGLNGVQKIMEDLLKKYGVEKIKAVGEEFDPLIHEAIQMGQEDQDKVTEEYHSGYKMFDKVIRPARVKVGK